jgi:hypothetical protein
MEPDTAQCSPLIPMLKRSDAVDTLKCVSLTLILVLPSDPGVHKYYQNLATTSEGDMKQVEYSGPANIRCHYTEFSCPVTPASGICETCSHLFLGLPSLPFPSDIPNQNFARIFPNAYYILYTFHSPWYFILSFLALTSFYLLAVGVEVIVALDHTQLHTHTHDHTL